MNMMKPSKENISVKESLILCTVLRTGLIKPKKNIKQPSGRIQ